MTDTEIYTKGEPVPYGLYELSQARDERRDKRHWIVHIIAFILIFASNALWLWAWTQYDYSSETIAASQDGEGINIVGGGDVRYGTDGYD